MRLLKGARASESALGGITYSQRHGDGPATAQYLARERRSGPCGNNGDLTVAWSVMKQRGWRSKTTLWRCKAMLIAAGFVYVTRRGHMPSTCELLALTWFPLDVSPKFDPEALACFRPKAYRVDRPLQMPSPKPRRDWTLPNGGWSPSVENANLSTPAKP